MDRQPNFTSNFATHPTKNPLRFFQAGFYEVASAPPCPDFSIMGSRTGFDGLRGTLTFHFYEKIMDLQPDFFLMENVPGLVLLNNTKDGFNAILDLYREEYLISSARLNALHY